MIVQAQRSDDGSTPNSSLGRKKAIIIRGAAQPPRATLIRYSQAQTTQVPSSLTSNQPPQTARLVTGDTSLNGTSLRLSASDANQAPERPTTTTMPRPKAFLKESKAKKKNGAKQVVTDFPS